MDIRIRLIAVIFFAAAVVISGRLFFWQVVKGENLAEKARLQQTFRNRIFASRGDILASDGHPLAASQDKWLVYASLPDIEDDPYQIASRLADLLKQDEEDDEQKQEEFERVKNLLEKDLVWVPIKNEVNQELKEKIEAQNIKGIGFEVVEDRLYPEASSSAHLLGFVGKDREGANKGYFGLEGYYDFTLSGSGGYRFAETDALGKPIIFGSEEEFKPKEGVNLLTHINKTVQLTIEEKLKEALEKYGAKSGSVVVMNPKNGAILGMASVPAYDPDLYHYYSDELFRNPVISDSYEPGSIFKPIVMAAGIDSGVVNPETVCDICHAPLKVDKYFIRTWNNEYRENSTMIEVLKNSDNVGMSFVAQKLGAKKLHSYLERFGFGRLTGIDLQGEASPTIRPPDEWSVVDLATASFGQGIAVTPIQMISAISVIANDGLFVVPQVVDKFTLENWQEDIKPEYGQRVISKDTADKITRMMEIAAQEGEAKWAFPKGYNVAGKTGTAQIPVAGHYDEDKTIASFIGFAPPQDAEFAMLVTLREPESSPWASETAAPLWFDIAKNLFPQLGIKPQ